MIPQLLVSRVLTHRSWAYLSALSTMNSCNGASKGMSTRPFSRCNSERMLRDIGRDGVPEHLRVPERTRVLVVGHLELVTLRFERLNATWD